MSQAPFDGNVTAGDLADIFAFDATTAITTCATCHHTTRSPRCAPTCRHPAWCCAVPCDAVQIRFVRSPQRGWLDLHGIDMLEIPPPNEAARRE